MSGAWRSAPLPWYVPGLQSCEAHWLAQVLERNGPVPISITLAGSAAPGWRAALRKVHGLRLGQRARGSTHKDPALEAILRAGIHLDTVSLARLAAAAAPHEQLTLDLLIDADVLEDFLALARERKPAFTIDTIGLAWRADAPRPPAMRSPLPHDAAADIDDEITDDAVIIAIIDEGVGIAHERFRRSASHTRVESFLDMGTWATTPACAPYAEDFIGRTWTRAEIDRCLTDSAGDDEAVYRAMGLLDARAGEYRPLRFSLSHGTHVLDIAAGEDFRQAPQRTLARTRPVLAVQLPPDVVADSSGAAMADALRHALHWIEHRARRLSQHRDRSKLAPLVLNFSFGTFAGPHDGHGEVERELARFTERYGPDRCRVVLPSGNGFQARAYAQVLAGPRNAAIAVPPWCVQPDDRTASFVQIWLPKDKPRAQQVEVSLKPPHGGPARTVPSTLGCILDWRIGEYTLARIYHVQVPRPGRECREMITIALRPSADANDDPRVCPSGRWQIAIQNLSLPRNAAIDLRIQRDDTIGHRRSAGRQSYFDDPHYLRFDPHTGAPINSIARGTGAVRRRGTLNAYATGQHSIVVAGYRASDGAPAIYSGAGRAHPGGKLPDLAAISEESPAHRGVLAAGTYSGACRMMNGTSVAAPQLTRLLAGSFAGTADGDDLDAGEATRALLGSPAVAAPPSAEQERCGRGNLPRGPVPAHRRRIE